MQELLTMRMKELDRLRVIQRVLAGALTWTDAAEQLTLSARQIGNVVARVRRDGARGVVHRLRGRPSNRRLPPGLIQCAVVLVKTRYRDFGPTFATEKLRERHGLALSVPTLRRGMIQAGLWRPAAAESPASGLAAAARLRRPVDSSGRLGARLVRRAGPPLCAAALCG